MSKHENFQDVSIEVPMSGTTEKLIVEAHFWDEMSKNGVTVVFLHAGRPHVSDPVVNDCKHSVARLVMRCEAGFSARVKNPAEPFNLTPGNLVVVKDGRAKHLAVVSQKPEKPIDLDVTPSKVVHPDMIDPGVGYGDEFEVREDIEETLPSSPDEAIEVDQLLDERELVLVIKDGHGLEGGIRSSRRVNTSHHEGPSHSLDTTDMQLRKLLNQKAMGNLKFLPSRGTKCKRWSTSYFNAGKVRKS